MSQVAQRVVTWDEYVRGEPANLEHYEIEDGVVIELPAPSLHHQRVVRRLLRVLEDFLASHRLGEVVAVPFDVVVQREPLRTRQPDLLVVLKGKVPQMEASPERLEIAPDLVVEVVSPHDSLKALMGKLNDYHRIGVRGVWLVNPLAKTVEVLERQEDEWGLVGVFEANRVLKSKVLPELDLPVVQIFEGA